MTNLSRELNKYFVRKSNKIIFNNGLNLNNLALEMWERLEFSQIDPSVLSKVINGSRLFTTKQISTFSKILKLKSTQENLLKEALLEDLMNKWGFNKKYFINTDSRELYFLLEHNLKNINNMRLSGTIEPAYLSSQELIEYLVDKIKKTYSTNFTDKINCIYLELLLESILCIQSLHSKNKASSETCLLVNQFIKNTSSTNSAVKTSFINYSRASNFYMIGKYKQALRFLKKVDLNSLGEEVKVLTLRQLFVCLAKLKLNIEFINLKNNAIKNINKYSISSQCTLLESISRGEAILGNRSNFEDSLMKAYQKNHQNEKSAGEYLKMRRVQLVRTELESAAIFNYKNSSLEKAGVISRETANSSGYKRHADIIDSLLNKVF